MRRAPPHSDKPLGMRLLWRNGKGLAATTLLHYPPGATGYELHMNMAATALLLTLQGIYIVLALLLGATCTVAVATW